MRSRRTAPIRPAHPPHRRRRKCETQDNPYPPTGLCAPKQQVIETAMLNPCVFPAHKVAVSEPNDCVDPPPRVNRKRIGSRPSNPGRGNHPTAAIPPTLRALPRPEIRNLRARTTNCSRRSCTTAKAYARPRYPSSARSATMYRLRGHRPALRSRKAGGGHLGGCGGRVEPEPAASRSSAGNHPATYRVLRPAWQACSSRCSWSSSPSRRRSRTPTLRTAIPVPSKVPAFTVVVTAIDTMRAGKPPAHRSARPRRACVAQAATRRASAPPESAGGPRCARPAPPAAPASAAPRRRPRRAHAAGAPARPAERPLPGSTARGRPSGPGEASAYAGEGTWSRSPAASRSPTGISQPQAVSCTELGKSPASRRRRMVVRLTPHAVAASLWFSIGRELIRPLPCPEVGQPTRAWPDCFPLGKYGSGTGVSYDRGARWVDSRPAGEEQKRAAYRLEPVVDPLRRYCGY